MSHPQFECNICLDDLKEPVVTKCGHLYCWKCLSEWLTRGAADCPVCKAAVIESEIVSIYARGEVQNSRPKTIRPARSRRNMQEFVGFPFFNDQNRRGEDVARLLAVFGFFLLFVILRG